MPLARVIEDQDLKTLHPSKEVLAVVQSLWQSPRVVVDRPTNLQGILRRVH